jgi:hypothetical protein
MDEELFFWSIQNTGSLRNSTILMHWPLHLETEQSASPNDQCLLDGIPLCTRIGSTLGRYAKLRYTAIER